MSPSLIRCSSAALLSLAGCGGPDFSLFADHVGEGVLLSAYSADADTLWFAGGDLGGGPGQLVRWDGATLCTRAAVTERALWWLHGRSSDDWWAVGEAGTALHHTAAGEQREDVPTTATLFGAYDDGAALWAVGGDVREGRGEVWRRVDGAPWEPIATDLPGVVFKVWSGWFVGDHVSYRWQSETLVPVEQGTRLLTVRGRDEQDVWAVGGVASAAVVRWDGAAWAERAPPPAAQPLNGVWTGPGQDVWIAGNFGTMGWLDGDGWHLPDAPVSAEHFHAAWGHGDDVFFAGGNLFAQSGNYGTIARYGAGKRMVDAVGCE